MSRYEIIARIPTASEPVGIHERPTRTAYGLSPKVIEPQAGRATPRGVVALATPRTATRSSGPSDLERRLRSELERRMRAAKPASDPTSSALRRVVVLGGFAVSSLVAIAMGISSAGSNGGKPSPKPLPEIKAPESSTANPFQLTSSRASKKH